MWSLNIDIFKKNFKKPTVNFFSCRIAPDDEKPEEANLFLTMAQLKDRTGKSTEPLIGSV